MPENAANLAASSANSSKETRSARGLHLESGFAPLAASDVTTKRILLPGRFSRSNSSPISFSHSLATTMVSPSWARRIMDSSSSAELVGRLIHAPNEAPYQAIPGFRLHDNGFLNVRLHPACQLLAWFLFFSILTRYCRVLTHGIALMRRLPIFASARTHLSPPRQFLIGRQISSVAAGGRLAPQQNRS